VNASSISRRAMLGGTAGAVLGLWTLPAAAAAAPTSTLDRVVSLVGDPDGYIDQALHAQFRIDAAKIAPDGNGAAEVARYAALFGDLGLHKAHSEALWDCAERSIASGRVVRTPRLDEVEAAIRVSEATTGRTRLSLYLEQTPKVLEAASKQSWAMLDGRAHTFIDIHVMEMRNSLDARIHRLAALFAPSFPPAKRRWFAPGCPVGFDTEVGISHIGDRIPAYATYRAQISASAALSGFVGSRGWQDADEAIFKQEMELALLQTKGKLSREPDRSSFRGSPSVRYLVEGTSAGFRFRADRSWLIPQRKIHVLLSISSNASAAEAGTWLDHIEEAMVLA